MFIYYRRGIVSLKFILFLNLVVLELDSSSLIQFFFIYYRRGIN